MTIDFVFPHNNEEDFIEMASKLGYSKLIFLYDFSCNIGIIKEKINRLKNKFDLDFGLLTLPKHINKSKKLTKYVFVQSSKDNRFVFEKNDGLIVFGLEGNKRDDFIHHRSSGLNHVLCSLAKDNNTAIAFSFNLLLKADPKLRAQFIGRIRQNIRLCNKYKVKTLIASFANDPFEMRSYKDMLGLLNLQTK